MAQFSSTTTDANGIYHLLNNSIVDIRFVDLSASRFANPDSTYTGYAADGTWYTAGVPDPTHSPVIATWATEGESAATVDRGDLDRFPDRLFIVATTGEVVLINADNLEVWMRFQTISDGSVHGSLLGEPGLEITQVGFCEGVLAIGTNDGLRIADFREDAGYWMGVTILSRSEKYSDDVSKGLVQRNEDGFLEFATVAGSGANNNKLMKTPCLSVSLGISEGAVVIAVGHHGGLSGVTMSEPPSTSVPLAKQHLFEISYTGWLMKDDNDADSRTPIFRSTASDNWAGDGVIQGDALQTDTALTLSIDEVNINDLRVSPEPLVAASGSSYTIVRPVPRTLISKAGHLYFMNGMKKLSKIASSSWHSLPDDDPASSGIDAFDLSTLTSTLEGLPSGVGALILSGSDFFMATDIGIFHVDEDGLAGLVAATNRYGWTGDTDSKYAILEGSSVVTAMTVDPETGHLFVAATSGSGSEITEIDMGLQQAFQSFDGYTSPVLVLTGYRNPNGPPTVEVS